MFTIEELKAIIAKNIDAAESGHLQAQGQVIEAQAEIDRLEAEAIERKELTEWSMFDADGVTLLW